MRVLTFKKAHANYLFNKGLLIFERERERERECAHACRGGLGTEDPKPAPN